METHTVFVVDGVEHRQGFQGACKAPWRGAGQGSLGGFQGPPFSLTPPPEAVQEKGGPRFRERDHCFGPVEQRSHSRRGNIAIQRTQVIQVIQVIQMIQVLQVRQVRQTSLAIHQVITSSGSALAEQVEHELVFRDSYGMWENKKTANRGQTTRYKTDV